MGSMAEAGMPAAWAAASSWAALLAADGLALEEAAEARERLEGLPGPPVAGERR